jgi:hypothetical protein
LGVIIFGVRGRIGALGTGQFYCPRCHGDRQYTRKGVRRWFTLFFVPIIPLGATQGARVCCDTCGGAFSDEVLSLPRVTAFRSVYRHAFRQCAVAVLLAGDATSAVARASAVAGINALGGDDDRVDDDALDRDLVDADPEQLAVAANPVANRLEPRQAERFFGGCAQIALSDGPLTDRERRALGILGESLHLTEAHQLGVIETLRAPVEPALDLGAGDG